MKLDWYFDFVSPFSYLQLERFDRLPAGTEVTLKPILFGALLKHLNQRGPAEIPHKREFTYKHVQWQADQAGIPLRFPPAHPFNPVRALRVAIALGNDIGAVRAIFRFIWQQGRLPDEPENWQALTKPWASTMPKAGSRNKASRTRCARTARMRKRPACSACRLSPPAMICSGDSMRRRC